MASTRDAQFRAIKLITPGACLHAELIASGQALLISRHMADGGGAAAFVEGRQGYDWPAYSIIVRDGICNSNLAVRHAELMSGGNVLLAGEHHAAQSMFLGAQLILSHGLTDMIVSAKSWWAFFLRYLASRNGK
jgi:hypothetical protein